MAQTCNVGANTPNSFQIAWEPELLAMLNDMANNINPTPSFPVGNEGEFLYPCWDEE